MCVSRRSKLGLLHVLQTVTSEERSPDRWAGKPFKAGACWAHCAMAPAALLHFSHPVQTFAGDFLSDHFGLLCELQVAPGPVASPPPNRAVAAAAAAKRQRLSPSASRAAAVGHSPVRLFG